MKRTLSVNANSQEQSDVSRTGAISDEAGVPYGSPSVDSSFSTECLAQSETILQREDATPRTK